MLRTFYQQCLEAVAVAGAVAVAVAAGVAELERQQLVMIPVVLALVREVMKTADLAVAAQQVAAVAAEILEQVSEMAA